jgi:hypothetical protein
LTARAFPLNPNRRNAMHTTHIAEILASLPDTNWRSERARAILSAARERIESPIIGFRISELDEDENVGTMIMVQIATTAARAEEDCAKVFDFLQSVGVAFEDMQLEEVWADDSAMLTRSNLAEDCRAWQEEHDRNNP